eukprot:s2608_g2.t3
MSEASRDGDPDHFLTVSLALQRLRDAAREADSEKGLEAMKTLLPIGGSDLVRFLAKVANTGYAQLPQSRLRLGGGSKSPRGSGSRDSGPGFRGPGIVSKLLQQFDLLLNVFAALKDREIFTFSAVSKLCHVSANQPTTWRCRMLVLNLRKNKEITETYTLQKALESISKRQGASLWRYVRGIVLPSGLRGFSKYLPSTIHALLPNIRLLDLGTFSANEALLVAILAGLKNLEQLHGASNLRVPLSPTPAMSPTKLKALTVQNALEFHCHTVWALLASVLPCIEVLRVPLGFWTTLNYEIRTSDADMESLRSLRCLRDLDISEVHTLTDRGLQVVAALRLEQLAIRRMGAQVSGATLRALAQCGTLGLATYLPSAPPAPTALWAEAPCLSATSKNSSSNGQKSRSALMRVRYHDPKLYFLQLGELRQLLRLGITAACGAQQRRLEMVLHHGARIGRKHPFLFGVAVSALKTSASDLMAQKVVERREEVDWRRNFIFFTWGLMYLGGVQYFIYVHLFARRWFPMAEAFAAKPWRAKLADRVGQRNVLAQVFFDQFVHHPFLLYPAFYQVKELIEGGTPLQGCRKRMAEVSPQSDGGHEADLVRLDSGLPRELFLQPHLAPGAGGCCGLLRLHGGTLLPARSSRGIGRLDAEGFRPAAIDFPLTPLSKEDKDRLEVTGKQMRRAVQKCQQNNLPTWRIRDYSCPSLGYAAIRH